MKLHGHTRVELTNVRTGQKEVVEKDNIITNAVSEIFNGFGRSLNLPKLILSGDENWSGAPKDFVSLFYGGLLLYDTKLGSDPTTRFAPAEAGIVGTALTNTVNSGLNVVRGSCNLTETAIDTDQGVATYVYDFTTSQGNGVIASVCLTSALGGYFSETSGTTPYVKNSFLSADFGGSMGGTSNLMPGVTTTSMYPLSTVGTALYADPENDVIVFGKLRAGTDAEPDDVLELRSYTLSLHSLDLFARSTGGTYNSLVSTKTLTLGDYLPDTTYSRSRLCCDIEREKLYLVCTSGNAFETESSCTVREYDINTWEYTDYTVTNNTGVQLSTEVMMERAVPLNGTVYDGWSYWRDYATGKRIFRIKLSDPTVVEEITTNGRSMLYVHDMHDGRMYYYHDSSPVVLNTAAKELLATETGGADRDNANNGADHAATVPVKGEPVTPLLRYRYQTSNTLYLTRVMRCNYLATINDLPEAVEKTADKTMKITYTLRKGA